jgi:hypothetical protein
VKRDEQKSIASAIKNAVERGIASVLDGQTESFEIKPFKPDTLAVSPEMVTSIMESLGWKQVQEEDRDKFDTNGWQYDWWMPFEKDGRSFTASGSGYYGGFGFHKTEEP